MLTIVYRSEMAALLPFSALFDICQQSAKKNHALGVTGFLVERDGVFLQVLEGETGAVEALYKRISEDSRHCNLEILHHEEAGSQRNFGFWAMNFGPLNDPLFWKAVFGTPMDADEFQKRSHCPEFALEVLSRAYVHACIVADADPALRDVLRGSAPRIESTVPV